jgi:hypothetical protein
MALRLNIPHFRTSDIVAIANVPQETIDQWVTLGHLSLDTRPHGRETGLYTGNDVLKVCAAAELSRLGIAPSRSAAGLAGLIANQCGVWYQQEHLHVWGDPDQLSSEAQNRGRFLSVHTDGAGRHTWSVVHDPGPDTSDPGRIVIDCFKIAERVFPELIARLA